MSDWDFADNERDQLRRWAQLSYAQRLQWLWEATLFARQALEASDKRLALERIEPRKTIEPEA